MKIRARASLLIAIVWLAGASVVFPAAAAPAPTYLGLSHVDCGQSWPWAYRVCYDTGSKWFHIYTTPPFQAPNISFPSNSGFSGFGQYAGQVGIMNVTDNTCNDEARWDGGSIIVIRRSHGACQWGHIALIRYGGYYDGGSQIGMYGGNWDYLVWFLSTGGYDFVLTAG